MNEQKIWIGSKPPADFFSTSDLLEPAQLYRVSPEHHRKYSSIHFIEQNLADYEAWPLILDELVRLAHGPSTFHLNIRRSSKFFSVAAFFNIIHKKLKGSEKLLHSGLSEDGTLSIVFSGVPPLDETPDGWTFGIVWDGKNEGWLFSFIDSVKAQSSIKNKQIIVCGPELASLVDENCRFIVPERDTDQFSNISRKKNQIVTEAKYQNVCIVHNRYELARNFIESFEQFGNDFDICTVPQYLASGERVPDWVAQGSDFHLTQNYLLRYDQYSPFQYLPGGLIIGKRKVLLENPWCDLATWNLAEDVELSQRLRNNGYIPRINVHTKCTVLGIRKEILDDFIKIEDNVLYAHLDHYAKIQIEKKNLGKLFFVKCKTYLKLLFSDPSLFIHKCIRFLSKRLK